MAQARSAFRGSARAFTLVELIAVIVVLAILSGVVIPRFFDYGARARESAVRGTLGNVRSAISNFYSNSTLTGTADWPTLVQMQTFGTTGVLMESIPSNPYNDSAEIQQVTWNSKNPTSGAAGWNYDAASGRFWANSDTTGENTW